MKRKHLLAIVEKAVGRAMQDLAYAHPQALQGYVAFSYDMVGYNDTMQTPHDFGGPREQLWSFGPMGLQLWNSMRALDFLQSLPDVDAGRIDVTSRVVAQAHVR